MLTQIELLKKYGLEIRGHLGQHLLIDPNLQRKTVDLLDLRESDRVLEIGPGLGALTGHILDRCGEFLAVEKDEKFVRILREELGQKLSEKKRIIHQDFLDFDLEGLDGSKRPPFKVISNLPYYITAPILFHLFSRRELFSKMVFTMQKEVSDRLLASPGSKSYGRLTLAVRYIAQAAHVFDIPPSCFAPKPMVHSSVVVLDLHPYASKLEAEKEKQVFEMIRVAFSQRRKTLLHLFTHDSRTELSREAWLEIFKKLRFPEKVRGEELLLKDYVALAEAFQKIARK